MNADKEKINTLVSWLEPRLGKLIEHSQQMRRVLAASGGAEPVVSCASELLQAGEDAAPVPLSRAQIGTWKTILPLLVEHSLAVVNGGAAALESDALLDMDKAANYLGVSKRKLATEMKRRAVAYQKLGAGRTSPVRFRREDLDKYLASRKVPAR